jgi:hypothetical protein
MEAMDGDEHENVEGWRLPARSRPPLLGELVERIDEALATARASEAAVMTVGAAALDAAEQAKRAAELAERASAAILTLPTSPTAGSRARNGAPLGPPEAATEDFSTRADRLAERLQRLQRMPLSA